MVLNTKLAIEYQRQYKKMFPSLETNVRELGGDIYFDFQYKWEDKLFNLGMWYESKGYTTDIPCELGFYIGDGVNEITQLKYSPHIMFVESFKTAEMNVNNMLVACNKLMCEIKNLTCMVYDSKNFNPVVKDNIEHLEAYSYAKKHKIGYEGFGGLEICEDNNEEFLHAVLALTFIRQETPLTFGGKDYEDTMTIGSYTVKHIIERFYKRIGKNIYCSTGIAAIAMWYVFVFDGACNENTFKLRNSKNSPNFDCDIPVKYYNALQQF
jgi:hypothetical protein